MKRMIFVRTLSVVLAAVMLSATLCGCGGNSAKTEPAAPTESAASAGPVQPAEPAVTPEPAASTEPAASAGPDTPTEPAEAPESGTRIERQDGERFEAVIVIEGMEEPVQYEHIRSEKLGFEMDYDCALFERRSDADRERFVCIYDDSAHPENYLELTRSALDAETVAASIGEELSASYDINKAPFTLERAGNCIRIDASADKGGLTMPEQLQMVYIIPAADGCRVAVAHYAIEGADGFGKRFSYMMHTLSVIG